MEQQLPTKSIKIYLRRKMRTTSYYVLLGLTLISSARATPSITFLSFDDGNSDQAAFDRAAGTFISGVDVINPVTNDSVNPSLLVGRYIRDAAVRWDWSSFSTSAIDNASLYLNGELAFQMDVLTYDAAIGTQIDITIEDTTISATECFPLGRHSRYTAVTSVQGAWERLTFSKLDQPDAGVANDAINAVLISYAPGQFVSGTFYIDNLVAVPATRAPTTPPPTSAPSPAGAILFDEFTAPNPFETTIWQTRLPLSRSAATTGVSIPLAHDGYGATLLYPANRPDTEWGPGYSTQIKSTEMNLYGNYEARLKSGRANAGEGVISAFFIYFNDEVDYDGDGIHDNHEIDFELLNSDRSSIWCSVYTDYQNVNDVCTFHRNAGRVDIATGEVWATIPGNEGNWDLVQIDSLDWSVPGFDHSASLYTYGFEWSESKVAFWIDLEDGVGRRQLFEVLSDGSGGPNDHIPNMPASTFFNLWHNNVDWFSRVDVPPMSVDTVMEIDYVSVMPISTTKAPTSHPTTLPPVPAPTSHPTTLPPVPAPTNHPVQTFQTVMKHICSKNKPLPATICADGTLAGGSCSTENRPDACGKGGKVCWWYACAV